MADSTNPPLPQADFLFLVESILVQAQMQLGLLNFGALGEDTKPDLASARHSIDLLGMLQEKTAGNLTAAEQQMLDNGATELRFHFVRVANEIQGTLAQTGAAELKDDGPRIITPDGGKGLKT